MSYYRDLSNYGYRIIVEDIWGSGDISLAIHHRGTPSNNQFVATFKDKESADAFMDYLVKFIGLNRVKIKNMI